MPLYNTQDGYVGLFYVPALDSQLAVIDLAHTPSFEVSERFITSAGTSTALPYINVGNIKVLEGTIRAIIVDYKKGENKAHASFRFTRIPLEDTLFKVIKHDGVTSYLFRYKFSSGTDSLISVDGSQYNFEIYMKNSNGTYKTLSQIMRATRTLINGYDGTTASTGTDRNTFVKAYIYKNNSIYLEIDSPSYTGSAGNNCKLQITPYSGALYGGGKDTALQITIGDQQDASDGETVNFRDGVDAETTYEIYGQFPVTDGDYAGWPSTNAKVYNMGTFGTKPVTFDVLGTNWDFRLRFLNSVYTFAVGNDRSTVVTKFDTHQFNGRDDLTEFVEAQGVYCSNAVWGSTYTGTSISGQLTEGYEYDPPNPNYLPQLNNQAGIIRLNWNDMSVLPGLQYQALAKIASEEDVTLSGIYTTYQAGNHDTFADAPVPGKQLYKKTISATALASISDYGIFRFTSYSGYGPYHIMTPVVETYDFPTPPGFDPNGYWEMVDIVDGNQTSAQVAVVPGTVVGFWVGYSTLLTLDTCEAPLAANELAFNPNDLKS